MLKSTILKRVISAVLVLASIFTIGTFSCFASDPPKFDVPKIKPKPQPHYEWRFDPESLADYQYDGQTWIDYDYIQFKINYEMENDIDDDI